MHSIGAGAGAAFPQDSQKCASHLGSHWGQKRGLWGCGRAESQHPEPMAEVRLPADIWGCSRALVQPPHGLE